MTDCTHERNLSKLRKDFGEVFQAALADSETVEIVLNSDGSLWHERLGEPLKKIGTMSASSADAAIRTLASYHHTTVTRENPSIECELPLDGSRFAGQISPLVSSPVFAVRKRASRVFTLEQYVEAGIITPEQKEFLCEAVKNHRNVLITGSTGSGKSTLLNGIIHELTDQFPNERLVIIEDTAEIQCSAKDYVQFGDAHAGERSAVIYSIIESCRRNGVEAYTYLCDVLTRLPSMTNWQIKDITPKAWANSRKGLMPKAA